MIGRRLSRGSGAPFLYLVAEPGYPNYGDELIAAEWLKFYARTRPTVPVVVDGQAAGRAAAYLWRFHPRVTVVDTVARLAERNMITRDSDVGPQLEYLVRDLTDSAYNPQYSLGIDLLNHHVQGVHVLGGGYLTGRFPRNLGRAAIVPWAQGKGLPAVLTGQGLAPLDGNQLEFARAALGGARLGVRDATSAALLPGAHLLPDDVFANGLAGLYRTPPPAPKFWVNIQSAVAPGEPAGETGEPAGETAGQAEAAQAARYDYVVEVLRRWGATPDQPVGVVECNPDFDAGILAHLQAAGWRTEFYPVLDLLLHGFPAAPGQVWLTTRYHTHLLASFAGASGAYLAVDGAYYAPKHEAVVRLGSGWRRAAWGEDPPDPGPGVADGAAKARRYAAQVTVFADAGLRRG